MSNLNAKAKELDSSDSLRHLRDEFELPPNQVYFCGNSLGPLPKRTRLLISQELNKWAAQAVEGHFLQPNPWVTINEICVDSMSRIVGAKKTEIAIMNSLTVNIHLLLASFYIPNNQKSKILIEKNAFPSDIYAVQSHVEFRGLSKEDNVLLVEIEEIISVIEKDEGKNICLVFLGGVNYQTGEVLEIEKLTQLCHRFKILIGFDLAHAAGNIQLKLSKWDVDFACWCTYKYLNSGPGGISCIYVNEKHFDNQNLKKLKGWWGHAKETRFKMSNQFTSEYGVESWQLSNPPVLQTVALRGSLDVFDKVENLQDIFEKSQKLTSFLETCLETLIKSKQSWSLITPKNRRGCQLSLAFYGNLNVNELHQKLTSKGFICDKREPNILRIAPAPLFNTFSEVYEFALALSTIMNMTSNL